MMELKMFKDDLYSLVHENVIAEKDIYSFVFVGYMIKKYNLDIDCKFDNHITFISYIKESMDNLSFSKDELNLLSESLNNIAPSLTVYSVKRIIKFINMYRSYFL